MAGHSKWAQIKRKKAVTDSRRGKLWTKLLKEITVAARLGGGDPAGNPRLRAATQEAKGANVPNANIDRAVRRGSGQLEGEQFEELTYEGYGPGGVAVLVEAMTDNKNRTVSDLRHLFSKHGGNLGEAGCVAWMFEKRGCFALDRSALGEEALMELALEIGAEDYSTAEGQYELFTAPEDYLEARDRLEKRGIEPLERSLAMLPTTRTTLATEDASGFFALVEALEDHEDVQHVWSNAEIKAEVLASRAG